VATRYFHGGAKRYERLVPGSGIDGRGIYLTSDRSRAAIYARSSKGSKGGGEITEVSVDLARAKVWDDDRMVDLRHYSRDPWVEELVQKYGPNATKMNGQNARIYLGWTPDRDPENRELRSRGWQAIARGSDLVVLDPAIMVYQAAKTRRFRDVGLVNGHWGHAGSGFLFMAGRKMLLLKRAMWTTQGGTYGIPGGAIPVDQHGRSMSALESARRETKEEIGRVPRHRPVARFVYRDGQFTFTTFVVMVEREFTPKLNDESDGFLWWDPEEGPDLRLHPGVRALLENRGEWS
jgi:8-oxo-dGTP pyrophosphatase MutT (NUDIX family)